MTDAATLIDEGKPGATTATDAGATTTTETVDKGATTTTTAADTTTTQTDAGATTQQQSDWRKAIIEARAKGDEAAAKKLEAKLGRFNDPGNLFDSLEESQRKITELTAKGTLRVPGADATDEDKAAFSKALGVPEKPDGYKIDYKAVTPDGYEVSDADKTDISAIAAALHAEGGTAATPAAVNAAAKVYFGMKAEAESNRLANALKARATAKSELQSQWGGDYTENVGLSNAGAQATFGKAWNEVRTIRLEDGTFLGDYKPLIEAMAMAGRMAQQDPLFAKTHQMTGDVRSIDQRIKEIRALRTSGKSADQAEYARASAQGGELHVLIRKQADLQKSN